MRPAHLVFFLLLLMTACAHRVERVEAVQSWNGRDVSELIEAIGPFETTIVQRGTKSYHWFRFGDCRVTARVSPDDKILDIETVGTIQGCSTYLQRMAKG